MLKIVTNGKPRRMVSFIYLPKKVQADFDYIKPGCFLDSRFVKFKGSWYDLGDTQRITTRQGGNMGWDMVVKPEDPLAAWDAIVSESFFSGILFRRYHHNGDNDVIVARYYS